MPVRARKCEITLVGDSGVGKTTIMFNLIHKRLDNIVPTIGLEYGSTLINNNGDFARVSIFDLSGNSIYKSMISTYFIDKDGLILAFNLNNAKSFNNLKNWMSQAKFHVDSKKPLYLIGIWIDKTEKRIDLELINSFVNEMGIIMYKEVSTSNYKKLRASFVDIVVDVMSKSPFEDVDLEYTDKDKLIEQFSDDQCCTIQ